MAIPSFFKQNRPREFNFVTRYYDADKEAHEERVRRIKREMGIKDEGDNYKPSITKGSMSSNFKQRDSKVQRNTTIRLIVIVLILLLISYFFFYL